MNAGFAYKAAQIGGRQAFQKCNQVLLFTICQRQRPDPWILFLCLWSSLIIEFNNIG